ncbi:MULTISPECIES: sulfite exporter TauE/SafE family protein [unclassified Streptomyces]|uniref:sulfite exporter TauE/SafE family protein n=1 Tax=unclassified Streptomyces TaxID=2593676 RepID=UPI000CD49BE2|nr:MULTISPECIES: sulfite exporter TauE/SafE family protein [unclassified Streptomyces]
MLTFFLVLFLFGCLTGVTTVLFGLGGGFVTVPVVHGSLVAAGQPEAMHVAVATSTAVMLVTATAATAAHHRQGRLRRDYLWPLAGFVGAGSVIGAVAATAVDGALLRLLFVGYLTVTIVDALARKGFLSVAVPEPRPLSRAAAVLGGTGIGVVAAGLGVGGSVLTVPLLRRRGLPMARATAMANPLAVPVALSATFVYALASSAPEGAGRLGYVDVIAGAALLAGALPTVAAVRRLPARVPDRAHSLAYLALLALILVAMVVTGGAGGDGGSGGA